MNKKSNTLKAKFKSSESDIFVFKFWHFDNYFLSLCLILIKKETSNLHILHDVSFVRRTDPHNFKNYGIAK